MNLWLLDLNRGGNEYAHYGACLGAVVAAETEFEARHTHPEPSDISCTEWLSIRFNLAPVVEQDAKNWFILDPEDPDDYLWSAYKHDYWDVDNITVTHIGTTDLPAGTVVLSSNYGD